MGNSCLRAYRVLTQAGEALGEDQIRTALRPCPPDLPQALDALCYHGLVVWEQDGEGYRIAGEMFQEWFTVNVVGGATGEPREEVGPMRILFLAANPVDTNPLRLSEEVRTIDERLRSAEFRDRFELIQYWAVRPTDLSECLLRHTPHIVHFSGHGSKRGEIILEDVTGKAKPVSPEALGRLFRVLKDNVRCVVLNACMSAKQAQAIAQEVDCVVGMSRAIGDEAAIRFAGGFYRALGYGRSVQTAFDLGCNEIDLTGLGEEATPKLLVRPGVDTTGLIFGEGAQRNEKPAEMSDLALSSQATRLHRILSDRLDLGEFRTLCFDLEMEYSGLGVNYDSLGGEGLSEKARELIRHLQKRNALPRLIEWLHRKRPDIEV
jgi:hypothetical protein